MQAPDLRDTRLLVVDDDRQILRAAQIILKQHFAHIHTLDQPADLTHLLVQHEFDVILLDMNFAAGATQGEEGLRWLDVARRLAPGAKVILMTAYADVDTAVNAMRHGATDFVVKPWDNTRLLATVTAAARHAQSDRELRRLQDRQQVLDAHADAEQFPIHGESPALKSLLAQVGKVAATDATVLITGENGTGKELIARAIHRQSRRRDRGFFAVDMGALTESLFESELFGHRKGAFTDAREDRAGRFEVASGGTLFLDEIGNLRLSMQAKLLGALATRTITRVGSDRPIPVDVRLVSATNLTEAELGDPARFRQDLLYRINTITLKVPPLRERRDDIPLLAAHFADYYARRYGKPRLRIDAAAIARLREWPWPGNVRELRHVIERVVILSEHPVLRLDGVLPAEPPPAPRPREEDLPLNLDELEKLAIQRALARFEGNLSRAAQALGLGRSTLYRKMARHGVS
nr:MAG: sigma-54-dependent Fis family transcriptional regulator [Pseudomonadota bacterium]